MPVAWIELEVHTQHYTMQPSPFSYANNELLDNQLADEVLSNVPIK